jgi:hypothetical protein
MTTIKRLFSNENEPFQVSLAPFVCSQIVYLSNQVVAPIISTQQSLGPEETNVIENDSNHGFYCISRDCKHFDFYAVILLDTRGRNEAAVWKDYLSASSVGGSVIGVCGIL